MLNILIDFVNFLLDKIALILNVLLSILPTSPFKTVDFSNITPYLGYINWFLPIGQMLAFTGVWVSAVLIYYAYTIILRVTQAID